MYEYICQECDHSFRAALQTNVCPSCWRSNTIQERPGDPVTRPEWCDFFSLYNWAERQDGLRTYEAQRLLFKLNKEAIRNAEDEN